MSLGIGLALLLAGLVAAFVLRPLFGGEARRAAEREARELDELRELHAREQMLLASLKDLEDDHATDKLDDEDYARLRAQLEAQTVEVLKRLDAVRLLHDQALASEREAARPLSFPGPREPHGSA